MSINLMRESKQMMGVKLLVVAIGIQICWKNNGRVTGKGKEVWKVETEKQAGLCGTDQTPTTSVRPQSFLLPYNHA
jgi:hypothetical protein